MEALRAEFDRLGVANVQPFIASGNVIFETRARDLAALERKIEAQLQACFGFEIHTLIRTEKELAAIVSHPAFEAAFVRTLKIRSTFRNISSLRKLLEKILP